MGIREEALKAYREWEREICEHAIWTAVSTGPLPVPQGWWLQGPPITAAADADPPATPKTPLQEAEDYVSMFLNGAKCVITNHEPATTLHKLIMLKMLRLDMPHQSTNIKDLDIAIAREAKK